MADSKTLRESRAKLVLDAQALIPATGVIDAETRTKFDKLMADADSLGEVIVRLEAEETRSKEERAQRMQIPNVGQHQDPGTPDEKEAFKRYIQYGERSSNLRQEYRAGSGIVVSSASGAGGGGAFVPQTFLPILVEAEKAWGGMLPYITQRKVDSGAPMKYAYVNDTSNSLAVVGEQSAPSETDPTTGTSTISSDMLTTGTILVSLQELQDSYFDIDSFLKNAIGKRYLRGLNASVTNGSSSNNVSSLIAAAQNSGCYNLTASGATSVANWVGQTLPASAFADIVSLYGKLDPAYLANATWVMNSSMRATLMGIQNTLGNPIFIPSPSAGALDTMLGRPVVLNQAIGSASAIGVSPVTVGNPICMFGDLSNYILTTAQELTVIRLNERFMDTLQVGFIGYARHGGTLIDAGTHPVVSLILY